MEFIGSGGIVKYLIRPEFQSYRTNLAATSKSGAPPLLYLYLYLICFFTFYSFPLESAT